MSDLPKLSGPMLPPFAGGRPSKIVVLAHGFGASGQDLNGLALGWRAAFPHTAFYSPNGPEKAPGMEDDDQMGYQWWTIRNFSAAESEAGIARAAPILDAFLDRVLDHAGLTEKDLALVGFSQGTMLVLHVGLSRAAPVAGILGYSGAVAAPRLLEPAIRSRPPVLLAHGDLDHMIPPMAMTSAANFLRRNGVPVETRLSPHVGHGIGPDGVDWGQGFLERVLGAEK
jgi:phospholipase/carboxylesterase